ncbi:DUF4176 domain-containing protein [Aggregatibacter actinomycetemcomitans]|nr:DUF4176 domain-containing protein [Aggregatibacter actinomycetemcomitans]
MIKEAKKLLPIGSVVRLKGADSAHKILIINRVVLGRWNGEEGYFEYYGCPHIIGAVDGKKFYFNSEQIEEVCFQGYVDNDEVEYQLRYQAFIENKVLKKLEFEGSE